MCVHHGVTRSYRFVCPPGGDKVMEVCVHQGMTRSWMYVCPSWGNKVM